MLKKSGILLIRIFSMQDDKKNVELIAVPANEYSITTLIDFNSPVLGTQHAGLKHIRDFKNEIAPAAHFVFCMNWKCCWIITL